MCAGLVGPKSENVEIPLVLNAFLKGQGGAGVHQPNEQVSGLDREHIFVKIVKKYGRKVKNAP